MSTADVTISCPHCRRQYTMKIDPERLQRLKTRATCGRCGKTFDAASRISPAHATEPATEPNLPRVDIVTPPRVSELKPTMRPPAGGSTTTPDLRDEMEELAREFAEAAARFTPVGIKRSSVGGGSLSAEAPLPTKPAAVEEPTNPGVVHKSFADGNASAPGKEPPAAEPSPPRAAGAATSPPLAAVPPEAADVEAAYDQLSLDAEPAGEEEFAVAVPTQSRAPAAARSWLELADPGLVSLQSPPSTGAAALEALLNESETIALPPPPAAS